MLKSLSTILLVSLLALIQSLGFSFLDIKPNLVISAVIAGSFFVKDLFEGLLLVAFSVLILKFSPDFGNEIVSLSLIGAASVMLERYLPWRPFVDNLVLIVAATIVFYLILAPNLIFSIIFLKESILNLVFGSLIFAFLDFLWQNKGLD